MAEHGRSPDRAKGILSPKRVKPSSAFARSRDRPTLCHRPITRSPIAHSAPAKCYLGGAGGADDGGTILFMRM